MLAPSFLVVLYIRMVIRSDSMSGRAGGGISSHVCFASSLFFLLSFTHLRYLLTQICLPSTPLPHNNAIIRLSSIPILHQHFRSTIITMSEPNPPPTGRSFSPSQRVNHLAGIWALGLPEGIQYRCTFSCGHVLYLNVHDRVFR